MGPVVYDPVVNLDKIGCWILIVDIRLKFGRRNNIGNFYVENYIKKEKILLSIIPLFIYIVYCIYRPYLFSHINYLISTKLNKIHNTMLVKIKNKDQMQVAYRDIEYYMILEKKVLAQISTWRKRRILNVCSKIGQ